MKYLFTIFTLLLSTNSIAYTNEQLGVQLAECSGWYSSSFLVMQKMAPQRDASGYTDKAKSSGGIAASLIGNQRVNMIWQSIMDKTAQAVKTIKPGADISDPWLIKILDRQDYCNTWFETNYNQIKRALGK